VYLWGGGVELAQDPPSTLDQKERMCAAPGTAWTRKRKHVLPLALLCNLHMCVCVFLGGRF